MDWWARQDSNLGPMDYESTALTAELRARGCVCLTFYSRQLGAIGFGGGGGLDGGFASRAMLDYSVASLFLGNSLVY